MLTGLRVRELTDGDAEAAWRLGALAFGYADRAAPPPPAPAGRTTYGAFDADGRLLGKAVDLHDEQWWLGRAVPAADVAGVAVLPEARGRGVGRALLVHLLAGARERGAAVSALYPTVAAPYRACGWEVTGALRTVELTTATLPRSRPRPGGSVRPGGPADLPAMADLYARLAAPRCGLLTRRGGRFGTTGRQPSEVDGSTLVEVDGRLRGYATWERGKGYGSGAVLTVHDLLADDAGAAAVLIGVLAGWGPVTPALRLTPLAHDATTALLPLEAAREHERNAWMHRPVDVVRAVEGRGWPAPARGTVAFALADDAAPWNAGAWRLEVADGEARLTRTTDEQDLRLTARGFALLYAGAASAVTVTEAGLAHCPPDRSPAALDLLGPGRPAELLDYF